MLDIANSLDKKDWKELDFIASSLKSAFAQIGAGRIHFILNQIHNAIILLQFWRVRVLYQLLVEECIYFKKHMKQLLIDYYRDAQLEAADVSEFKIASGYRVVYETEKEDCFCLADN